MAAMDMSGEEQFDVISTTAAVLHLGNITFTEAGVEKAVPEEADCRMTPCVNCSDINKYFHSSGLPGSPPADQQGRADGEADQQGDVRRQGDGGRHPQRGAGRGHQRCQS